MGIEKKQCPKCGSEQMEHGRMYAEDNFIRYSCKCRKCGCLTSHIHMLDYMWGEEEQ